jgi:LysR family glycine cleavage system transcriptional activator
MSRNLAHLNALYAFEASARLGSFTGAAAELGVTPAAVGQQVRILEDYLGRKVFHRTANGLQATRAASLALTELHDGFDRLETGFRRLRGPTRDNQLSLSVAPALAWKWLAPRMQGLYERCPQIDLRMDTSLGLVDIAGGEFDVAVRYGEEEQDGLKSTLLFEEHILPVCAPNLYKHDQRERREEAVATLPLLHIEGETSDSSVLTWRDWGTLFGLDDGALNQGPRYPVSAMALQAALGGQGVALCGLTLVIDDLIAGRLVAPLGNTHTKKTDFAYRLVHSTVRHPSAIQATVMRWITAEATKTNAVMAGFLAKE